MPKLAKVQQLSISRLPALRGWSSRASMLTSARRTHFGPINGLQALHRVWLRDETVQAFRRRKLSFDRNISKHETLGQSETKTANQKHT